MIHIKKNLPPSEFISFIKETPNIHFDDLPSDIKDILRKSLLKEQYGLCAFQDKKATVVFLKKTLKFYTTPKDGQLEPYCGILIDYLEKKIKAWS